jgi:carboxyl-terminal processing protease
MLRMIRNLTAVMLGVASCLCMRPGTLHAQRASFEELQTFSAVMNHIRINYVDSVSYTPLVRAAIAGALSALDPHSRYVRLEASNIVQQVDHGVVASVGLQLDDTEDGVIVAAVGPGSASERAGILALDRVVAVNDSPTIGLESTDVEARLAGMHDSAIRLTVERGAKAAPQRFAVRLKRANYTWPAVSAAFMLDSITGYVRFNEFTPGAAKEVERAIKAVQGTGAHRLILDLRGNPGGVVNEAVSIAGLFLPEKTLVFSTAGRATDADEKYVTTKNGPFTKLPLVMMVDGGSASASEALAGALQDHDRALLVGHRSFGKALVQAPFALPAGDVLWLTIARVISPSGRIIQRPYNGMTSGQYRAFAGTNSDTTAIFRSDAGRPLGAGGGIAPDITLPARPDLPPWSAIALDSAIDVQVIQSASASLPASVTADAWTAMSAEWNSLLLDPFLAQVSSRIVAVQPDERLRSYMARFLAVRFAETRWGNAASARIRALTDTEVTAALAQFGRLPELLNTH